MQTQSILPNTNELGYGNYLEGQGLSLLFGWTARENQDARDCSEEDRFQCENMPKKVSCRVPKCLNNFKNNPGLRYYRIPENPTSKKEYKRLLRHETSNINSDNIRISILNLKFHKAAVSGHYCFLSMLTNFLRLSNDIFLIPVVMQMTHNCSSRLHQEMIWRRLLQ